MCRPNANLFLFFVIVWHLFFALYEKWGFPAEKRCEQEAYNLLRRFIAAVSLCMYPGIHMINLKYFDFLLDIIEYAWYAVTK